MVAIPGNEGVYSYSQLEQLWLSAGGSKALAPVMAAIAEAESGGNPTAHNPSGASGLWQILGQPFKGNVYDPQTNAKMAVAKYKSQGLGAWTTYTSGAYKKYLQSGTPAGGVHGGQALLDEAKKFIGVPYVWGGSNPKGFDCSGLVQYALESIGVKNVPRTSEAQWRWVQQFQDPSQLKPGDLVFLNFPGEVSPGHVMIWAGNNTVVQAPSTGQDVQTTKFDPRTTPQQWGAQLVGFGHVPGISKADYTGSSSSGGGGGGLLGWLGSVANDLGTAASDLNPFSAVSDVAQAIGGLAQPFIKIAEAIDWFFVPSHWVRIGCLIGGSFFTVAGVVTMTRTGRGYSVSSPVAVYGVSSVPAPGGQIAPAIGIAEVTIGAVLLFVAFHNLPSDVETFGGFVSHLQGELQNQGKQAE